MKITTSKNDLVISCSGMENVLLKTKIAQRLGSDIRSDKNTIRIHLSDLPIIRNLLDEKEITDEVVDRNKVFTDHCEAKNLAKSIILNKCVDSLPADWIRLLDPAQAAAVAAMILPGCIGLCLFDEQGSGKTVMSIAAFDIMKNNCMIDIMIVVCPLTMVNEWPKDINKLIPNKYNVVVADGNRNEKYEASYKKYDVLVTNYEGVDVMLTTILALAEQKNILLVIDESYHVKNSDAQRSEAVGKLREKCARCYVLCGTPAPNSAYDLINQFNLADLGYTFNGFQKTKNIEDDTDVIANMVETKGFYIRRLKNEILEHVPAKCFNVIAVDMIGKQAMMYHNAKTELELVLKKMNNETFKKSLRTYLQKRMALLQICACPATIDVTFSEANAKLTALDSLIDSLVKQNRKVVIWSYYTSSIDDICHRYSRYNPVRIDGSIAQDARKNAVDSFQNDPQTMIFVGNPSAAGAGITLHTAYDAVYVSYSNQAAHYLQSLDRIHRRGQKSDVVNYYLIICKDTIEESEVIKLRAKEIRQHELLGDYISFPTSLDDALKELNSHV